jgi:hypothetical protein
LNDSDSDGDSFSELSDSDTCKVYSPFSSSSIEEEEVVQPEPDRQMKRIRKVLPKCANTDSEFGWKEQIQTVQEPAFCGVPGINKNLQITQDSSPWDIFEIFFSPEIFKLIQKETNRYAEPFQTGMTPCKCFFKFILFIYLLNRATWNV